MTKRLAPHGLAVLGAALLYAGCTKSRSQSELLKRQEAILARQEALLSRLETTMDRLESAGIPGSVQQQKVALQKQIILLQRKLEDGKQFCKPRHPMMIELEQQIKDRQAELSALEQARTASTHTH